MAPAVHRTQRTPWLHCELHRVTYLACGPVPAAAAAAAAFVGLLLLHPEPRHLRQLPGLRGAVIGVVGVCRACV